MLAGIVAEQSLLSLSLEISVSVVEAVVATDASDIGSVVFASLVDDPASVGDLVDAYLGEIMLEPASAAATVEAGLIYVADIDEGVTTTDAWNGAVPTIYTDAIVEAASAGDIPSAAVGVGTAVTTTSVAGPLFVFDATFPHSSLTVINVGQ